MARAGATSPMLRRLHSGSGGRLVRPPTATIGTAADVAVMLPLTAELSVGARKSVPAWVVGRGDAPTAVPRGSRAATWLELTYPMATDASLQQLYSLADGTSLRAGMFMEEIDAFSADCALRHALGPTGQLDRAETPLTV
eukprot:784981-Prymnesium_polylepis.1